VTIDRVRVGYAPLAMAQPMRTAIHEVSETHNAVVEIGAGGAAGQGAALTLTPAQGRAVSLVAAELARPLLGRPAPDIEAEHRRMLRQLNLTGRTGLGLLAVAAIDTALWDLAAQQAGVPLHRLVGGTARSLSVYAQPGWLSTPVEGVIAEALGFAARGIRYYKMRVGSPDWRQDVERVTKVREALPGDIALLVDANQGWTAPDALEACRALDDLGLYWIEEPVDALDLDGCAAVAAAVTTPIAAGETLFGRRELLRLVEAGAVSVLMPDLQHCAGPTGFLEVMRDPALAGVRISNHLFTEVSIHLLAAGANAELVELMPGWWDDLFDRPLDIVDGTLRPPDEPGIGYRLSEQATRYLEDA